MSDQDRIAAFSDQSGDIRQEELTQYLPVSRTAILALLVGVLSALSIFNNILWILPLVGVILATVALRHTAPPDAIATGRTAAIIGLALSVLFGVLAVTSNTIEKRLVTQQATEFAERWLGIARSGNLPQAAEWLRAPLSRLPFESNYAEFYEANEDAKSLLENFSSGEALKQVLALEENDTITFKGLDDYTRVGKVFLLDLRFALPVKTNANKSDVICSVRRTMDQNKTRWSVASFSLAD